MRVLLILAAIVTMMPLMSCAHQFQEQTSQTAKVQSVKPLSDIIPLRWKCPTVAFQRANPDGTVDDWGTCAIEIGDNVVYRNNGAIVSLGTLMSREDIGSKTFSGHSTGVTHTADSVHYVSYSVAHDPGRIRVGYEVTFAGCAVDNFTLYINDKDEKGALEALDYTIETMKHTSYCGL